MPDNPRSEIFDSWSGDYDRDVHSGEFPFEGYAQVLATVLQQASLEPGLSVLELGPGTGILTGQLVDRGCRVLALDFSAKMIEKARERVPRARFVQADLLGEWPGELLESSFDRILSTYLFHEFKQPVKIRLLRRLATCLARGGKIVIGDIAFEDDAARIVAMNQYPDAWDEEEEPWAASEDLRALADANLQGSYTQVSSCGGVFVIQPGDTPAMASS
jgi:putative AdoMet-dependent methyltransferase